MKDVEMCGCEEDGKIAVIVDGKKYLIKAVQLTEPFPEEETIFVVEFSDLIRIWINSDSPIFWYRKEDEYCFYTFFKEKCFGVKISDKQLKFWKETYKKITKT